MNANPTQPTSKAGQTGQSTSSNCNTFSLSVYDAPRRSLRQKGLLPVVEGLPYYAPMRPRTPKKQDEQKTTEGGGGDQELNTLPQGVSESGRSPPAQEDGGDNGYPDSRDSTVEKDSCAVAPDAAKADGSIDKEEETKELQDPSQGVDDAGMEVGQGSVRRQLWNGDEAMSTGKLAEENVDTTQPPTSKPSKASLTGGTRRRSSRLSSINPQSFTHHESSPSADTDSNMAMDTTSTQPPSQPETLPSNGHTNSGGTGTPTQLPVSIDRLRLLSLFERVVVVTGRCAVKDMEVLHSTVSQLVFRYRMHTDRHQLLEVGDYIGFCNLV